MEMVRSVRGRVKVRMGQFSFDQSGPRRDFTVFHDTSKHDTLLVLLGQTAAGWVPVPIELWDPSERPDP
jgi:hypothetical protein